ncbi:TRM11 family SAM-dependent methyltransferase [Dermacoccaceae bacterium W4C1]
MPGYLLLLAPSTNRVFAADAPRLVAAELTDLLDALTDQAIQIEATEVAGVPYLRLDAESELEEKCVRAVSAASGVFAAYALIDEHLLSPLHLPQRSAYPDDLLTIQKYPGKTNEQWTRLLLNVTAAATRRPERLIDQTLTVLDPMCGRGTTLNIALAAGLDVTGIDIDKRDFEHYERFLKTWMRNHRFKHIADVGALRSHGKSLGRRMQVEVATSKEAFMAGEVQRLTYLNADSRNLDGLLAAAQFDVIVTDTPYGVEHGSHGDRLDRSPLQLLEEALPGWVRSLRQGGAVGLSYNRHVAPPEQLADLLSGQGLQIIGEVGEERYRHRVDASIDRDLMVATKA